MKMPFQKTPLFDLAFNAQSLNQSWQRFKNEKSKWQKNTDMDQLKAHFPLHLMTLLDEVKTGQYRPDRVKQFSLMKGNGKERIIQAQTVRDKFVQRCVLNAIEPIGEKLFHNDSYGYRPNRNVEDGIARVKDRLRQGLDWIVDADIQTFFDTIPHDLLLKQVEKHLPDKKIQTLIKLWLAEGPHHTSLFGTRRGLAQGSVISPFLTNLYLHQFDQSLQKANIPFVRFADDFVLLTTNKEQAQKAQAFAAQQLKHLGLALNKDKTHLVHHPSQGLHFLGKFVKQIKYPNTTD